jgi:hypothetical protein
MPLSPLYVLTANALGYLLENAHIQGQMWVILLPNGSKMVNNHFADESLLYVWAKQSFFNGAPTCLDVFYSTSGVVVNEYKVTFC